MVRALDPRGFAYVVEKVGEPLRVERRWLRVGLFLHFLLPSARGWGCCERHQFQNQARAFAHDFGFVYVNSLALGDTKFLARWVCFRTFACESVPIEVLRAAPRTTAQDVLRGVFFFFFLCP